ncbi:MAG: hypothetical protein IK000_00450 [Bacteroidaceae bacterium]|nr:hypothetical protein [Bacteroidaceae bacterium]
MNRTITKDELWNLSNEQIAKLTEGRTIIIVMNDGTRLEIIVKKLITASNPPHLFVGFLTDEDKSINLQSIDYIELND